ncbi:MULTISPECIES: hypothetical protein [Streptomyces]|uniref:DUF3040 domain-containing protein n=2 Tax=Streptomyces TaxID=1883 RepID=A0ABV9J5K5_9ACTN
MNRDRGDQELRDFYELLIRRADLNGPGKAALLEAWNAEQQRKHERLQRADEWKRQRFETVMGFLALIALLLTTVWLTQKGHEWVAVALIPLTLVVVAKFLGRPVTASEANLVGSGVTGAFRGLRQSLTGAAPQPGPAVGSAPITGPASPPVP